MSSEPQNIEITQQKRGFKKINGKIILVDDRPYERALVEAALSKKHWAVEIEYFDTPELALDYLRHTNDTIFLMLSDIAMPKLNGLKFKRIIDSDIRLKRKLIPFIFISNSATNEEIEEAYDNHIQGYFRKPFTIEEQAEMLDSIIEYWLINVRPEQAEQEEGQEAT